MRNGAGVTRVPLVIAISVIFVLPGWASASSAGDPRPMDDFDTAAGIADKAFYAAKEILYQAYERSLVEQEVIDAIDASMKGNGSDPTFGFGTLVASGPDSAIPHGDPSNDNTKAIGPGEVVWADYGPMKNGKCADETRTFLMAPVPEEARYVYGVVLEAQDAALTKMKDGAVAGDADFAARSVFEKYQYDPHFIHSLGHGMGTQVHEPPTLGPGSTETIPAGKIVSDEPGLYFEGDFGIRVEDDVRSMPSSGQMITFAPKSLEDSIIYPPISFEKLALLIPDTATVILHDSDFNKNPSAKDTTTAEVLSTTETTPEVITLTETGVDTAIFKGTIAVESGTPTPDGKLQAKDGDTITARYQDPNPSKQRTAAVKADAVVPTASNIAVAPDVASAVISWKTDEPTNGTIFYGTSTSLGKYKKDFGLRTDHKVLMVGLQPNTTYYFDVGSWDGAINMLRSDNSGAHFTFKTLEGAFSAPGYGQVGYVRSDAPSQNYFKSTRMYAGESSATFYGAFQFNISGVPKGASVLGASVAMYGVGWDSSGSGNWKLGLLNASTDANWQYHGYTDISGTKVDAYLDPTVSQAGIKARVWNTFNFTAAQYKNLMYQISKGKASFRFDGPSGYALFYWATGYFPVSQGNTFRPALTIRYATSSDTVGPSAMNLAVAPDPTDGAAQVTLTGKVSDVSSGNSPISAAEWFEGMDPGPGNGKPLSAKDGSYDSPEEEVKATIDVTTWSLGTHELSVRGKDNKGNWGGVAKVSFTKTLPKIGYVTVSPASASMKVGDVQMFQARTFTAAGAEIKTGVNYTWSLSGGIGSVTPNAGPFTNLTASSAGQGSLTVSAECYGTTKTNSSSVQVTGKAQKLAYVSLTPLSQTLVLGSTLDLTATAMDASGVEVAGAAYSWSVSGAIGSLNATSGKTVRFTSTAIGSGTVRVTASFSGDSKENTSQVSVIASTCSHLCGVQISPTGIEMMEGERRTFTAAGLDENGNKITSGGVTFVWKVTQQGKLIDASGGSANIEATTVGAIKLNVTATYMGENASKEILVPVKAKSPEQQSPISNNMLVLLSAIILIVIVALVALVLLMQRRKRRKEMQQHQFLYQQ